MNNYEENLIPFFHNTDPKYFDLIIPPMHEMNAEYMMRSMAFQMSMVPKIYRDNPEVWQIYDLVDYQRMIAGYIQKKAEERKDG